MLLPRFHHFAVVDSTNDLALELARQGEPEGTIVTAGRQLNGKGRLGRSWWDEPGQSVLMSVILPAEPETAPQLAFVASLAAADCLSGLCELDIKLKWPNDIMLHGCKLGGVLIETAPEVAKAVVGIGINVNQIALPPELAGIATSIAIGRGTCLDVDDLTIELCHSLFSAFDDWSARGFEEILNRWRNYMWGAGRQAQVDTEGDTFSGQISGVDPSGALLVRRADGAERVVIAADSVRIIG